MTLIAFFISTFLVGILSYYLFQTQRELKLINDQQIPLVEYSSALVRVNNEVVHSVNSLDEIRDEKKKGKLEAIADKKNILSEIIFQFNEIAPKSIDRSKLDILEQGLLSKLLYITDRGQSQEFYDLYKKSSIEFSDELSSKIEETLIDRDKFQKKIAKRNDQVLFLAAFLLIILLGTLIKLTIILRENVKALRKTLDNLNAAKEENEALVRVLSHDLSTPLMVAKVSSKIDPKTDTAIIEQKVSRLQNALSTMNDLLRFVKEIASLKQGKIEVTLKSFNLVSLVESSIALFSEKAREKKLVIELECERDSMSIISNEILLKNQVINNILSNCIKFSPDNSKIIIKIIDHKEGVVLSIRDYGIGMPKDILENLFRTDVPTTREGVNGESGTGFGMPIVKTYLEKCEGQIEVESWEEGDSSQPSGTLFRLYLPVEHKTALA